MIVTQAGMFPPQLSVIYMINQPEEKRKPNFYFFGVIYIFSSLQDTVQFHFSGKSGDTAFKLNLPCLKRIAADMEMSHISSFLANALYPTFVFNCRFCKPAIRGDHESSQLAPAVSNSPNEFAVFTEAAKFTPRGLIVILGSAAAFGSIIERPRFPEKASLIF
jgi:hypothetical protein